MGKRMWLTWITCSTVSLSAYILHFPILHLFLHLLITPYGIIAFSRPKSTRPWLKKVSFCLFFCKMLQSVLLGPVTSVAGSHTISVVIIVTQHSFLKMALKDFRAKRAQIGPKCVFVHFLHFALHYFSLIFCFISLYMMSTVTKPHKKKVPANIFFWSFAPRAFSHFSSLLLS